MCPPAEFQIMLVLEKMTFYVKIQPDFSQILHTLRQKLGYLLSVARR